MATLDQDREALAASRKIRRGAMTLADAAAYLPIQDMPQADTSDMEQGPEDDAMSFQDAQQVMFSRQGIASDATPEIMSATSEDAMAATVPGLSAPIDESWLSRFVRWADPNSAINIALELDESKLGEIGMAVVEEARIDEVSREEWLSDARKGLDMALQKSAEKSYPWPRASNVVFPLITQAADQFAARAYPAIVQNRNVVKGAVIGDDDGDEAQVDPVTGQPMGEAVPAGAKAARAQRIGDHMSYQFLEEMPEWEEETDKLINILPIVGCQFRKTYWDPAEARIKSLRISHEDLIVNYWARSMETAPRITEVLRLYPYEIEEHKNSNYFVDQDYALDATAGIDKQHPVTFYEQHRRYDLDGDGYPEPYIVTVHKETMKVARIVARWDQMEGIDFAGDEIAKINPVHYYTKYDFLPNKEGGLYGMGFAHNLKTLNEAVSSTLNMLIDAGHLQNTGGGFVGKGLGMMSGAVRFRPGEYKVVNAAGQDIRNSIVMMDHRGPSPVLFQLLGMLIEAGKDISSVKDVMTGEVRAQTMSPTVFMALVEQGLKVFTAIYKRVHRSLKAEFAKVYRLNRIHLPANTGFRVGDAMMEVSKADYEAGAAVVPFSDPTMVVDAQKMARTQVLAEFKDDPMMNGLEIRKRILDAAAIDDPDEVLKGEPAPNPEMLAKVAELKIRELEARTRFMVGFTQSLKNLADADAAVAAPFQQWAAMQMQQVQNEYERTVAAGSGSPAENAPGGPAGGAGTDGGPVGAMAPPPGNEGVPPILG